MGDRQPNWSISTALTTRMLREIYTRDIRLAKMRLGNDVRMYISYCYLLLFWTIEDRKMWFFVGKDENCVQRGRVAMDLCELCCCTFLFYDLVRGNFAI